MSARPGRGEPGELFSTGDLLSEVFDGVMCCTGHHSLPRWPEPFPGQQSFRGRLLHSHGYRSARDFEDKTVVVLGVGNSGSDIAVELSKTAKQVGGRGLTHLPRCTWPPAAAPGS